MDKYTPTTKQVRDQYAVLERLNNHAEYSAEFDRWLAEVKAQAVRDYLEQRMNSPRIEATVKYVTNNAYRQVGIL